MKTFIAHVYDSILLRTTRHEFAAEDVSTQEEAMPVAEFLFSNRNSRVTKVTEKEEKIDGQEQP